METKYTLEQVKKMLIGITPGPWHAVPVDGTEYQKAGEVISVWSPRERRMYPTDAKFIAAAPEIIAWLMGEVERLQQAIQENAIKDSRVISDYNNKLIDAELQVEELGRIAVYRPCKLLVRKTTITSRCGNWRKFWWRFLVG